ncbi:formylglycine-generating enzyme family protein [Nitrosomonas oligotropha]|uniref:formylglycine-generating enzyme family protein n=1 Tax=Nitrosomonas oligotropha TaxID=42354 RepID=UPI0035BFF68C
MAYCRWLSVRLQLSIRLPTEWEWQWAAVASTQKNYPWGEWNEQRANSYESGIGRTVAVGLYPLGRGSFGVDDMTGNVLEWCLNSYDQPSDIFLNPSHTCVLRGGSWNSSGPGGLRASMRGGYRPNKRNNVIGFRILCLSPID